jgi:hypothetical protein
MTLWLILSLMTAAAIFAVLWPLSRRGSTAVQGHEVAVYRDQLDEVERDRKSGPRRKRPNWKFRAACWPPPTRPSRKNPLQKPNPRKIPKTMPCCGGGGPRRLLRCSLCRPCRQFSI